MSNLQKSVKQKPLILTKNAPFLKARMRFLQVDNVKDFIRLWLVYRKNTFSFSSSFSPKQFSVRFYIRHWGAMYNSCAKIIYQEKKRFKSLEKAPKYSLTHIHFWDAKKLCRFDTFQHKINFRLSFWNYEKTTFWLIKYRMWGNTEISQGNKTQESQFMLDRVP